MINFEKESVASRYQIIQRYEKGKLFTTEACYAQPIALFKQQVYTHFLPDNFDELNEAHFANWCALNPELIILGTGTEQQFFSMAQQGYFLNRQLAVEIMNTASALRTFNILLAEERLVLGLFYLP